MANSKPTTSAQDSETKQVYLDVLREYNKSHNIVSSMLENVDTIVRSSARAERNRLINNWNDYVDATVLFLEVMDEDGEYGGQQEAYDATRDLYIENRSVFERMYKDLNDILDHIHKKKVSTKRGTRPSAGKDLITGGARGQTLGDLAHVGGDVEVLVSDQHLLPALTLSGDDRLRKVELREFADSSSMRAVANDTHYVPPNQIPLTLRDSGILSRNLESTTLEPEDLVPEGVQVLVTRPLAPAGDDEKGALVNNKIKDDRNKCRGLFNLDAFEKRKDATSVSLSRTQVLVTRPLVPAGEEKEALASLEDGIGAHAPVDVQALVTRPLAPAGEEKEVFKIKATKLVLLMKKMSCLVELKLEMTSANLAALSSGERMNQVPGRSSLATAKQDLVLAQVLVTRPLASAGEGHEALASLEDEKEALASLEDLKDARTPVKDLIPVDVQVLVTGPREELVLLLGKISSLWALKIKPLKILILMSKYLSPISASPRLQEVQQCLKDEEGARARVEDLVPVGGHVLVTRLFAPAVEENEALASLEEEKEALASREDEAHVLVTKLALVTGCSALWVVEIKPLKLLVFKIKPFKLLLLMKKMSRLAELKLTSANLAALSSVVLGHSTREDLVLLLGKISSLWALKIKPLKILADKGRYVRGYSIQTLY
jgi:hypothetical protein